MEWMMVHPWMTFILLLTAIECASNIVANICRAIVACRDNKDILSMEKKCRGSGKGIEGKRGEMVKELDTLANEVINF